MAFISSVSCLALSLDHERPDLESVRALVISINQYILEFLSNSKSWNSLKSQFTSKLDIQNQEFFEFSEHSVLSNLYWAIESIEVVIQARWPQKKTDQLRNSERLLQVPALLDEHGVTAGLRNSFLVCCSYFYLSVVKKLQNDEWQVALHFLQAMLVSPRLVRTEFAPEFCGNLLPTSTVSEEMQEHQKPPGSIDGMRIGFTDLSKFMQQLLFVKFNCSDINRKLEVPCFSTRVMSTMMNSPHVLQQEIQEEVNEGSAMSNFFSPRVLSSISDLDLRVLELRYKGSDIRWNCQVVEDNLAQRPCRSQVNDQVKSRALQNCKFTQIYTNNRNTRTKLDLHSRRNYNELCGHRRKDSNTELTEILEKAISKLCFSEGLAKCEEDYAGEVTTIYKILNNKRGMKYTMLKDEILDQLLTAISTSKEERVIRASVSILTTIISVNSSAIEDIKKKGLRLCDLATALKRNVHEAAILIHLINPSPTEIKTLELLPALVEVVCTSNSCKEKIAPPLLTPHAASLMIIEILVTAFDCDTNNMHLAAINSPQVLCGLLKVAGNNLNGYISLANVLVRCMQFDGKCRKYVEQFIPVAPFICLLESNEKRAKFAALEFFHELLRMPRSSAISLMQQMLKEGGTNTKDMLMHCIQELQPEHQLLASNILVQLETLENSSDRKVFTGEAMQIILQAVESEESSGTQQLSAFILANLGGTFAWTGEPYTVAWLVKKAGLTSMNHQNMIRNFNWLDQNLFLWCGLAKSVSMAWPCVPFSSRKQSPILMTLV